MQLVSIVSTAHRGVLCPVPGRQLLMPHTVHTKTIADKTELNDDWTKNRGDRSFLAVGQLLIYRRHYSYSEEGIKDNRNAGKTSYKRISQGSLAIDFNS